MVPPSSARRRASSGRDGPVGTAGLFDRQRGRKMSAIDLPTAGHRTSDASARSRPRTERFGYRRLFILLRQDGTVRDRPHLPALPREGLTVRKRRRGGAQGSAPIVVEAANARWSLDFVHDQLACADPHPEHRRRRDARMPGGDPRHLDLAARGARADGAVERRGKPAVARTTPEFTSNAVSPGRRPRPGISCARKPSRTASRDSTAHARRALTRVCSSPRSAAIKDRAGSRLQPARAFLIGYLTPTDYAATVRNTRSSAQPDSSPIACCSTRAPRRKTPEAHRR